MTITKCFTSLIRNATCKPELFKLYKRQQDQASSIGSFIQTTQRCEKPLDRMMDSRCWISPHQLYRHKPANFHFIHLDQDMALVYSCEDCTGMMTNTVEELAFVLSREPKPSSARIAQVEAKLGEHRGRMLMSDARVVSCDSSPDPNQKNELR